MARKSRAKKPKFPKPINHIPAKESFTREKELEFMSKLQQDQWATGYDEDGATVRGRLTKLDKINVEVRLLEPGRQVHIYRPSQVED